MSFILDALRKSEHERQRTAMPSIAQVPFGLPRREMPSWAIALIVVLGVTVLALGGAWWRSSRSDSAASAEPPFPARTDIPLALPPSSTTPPATVYSAPPATQRSAAARNDVPAASPRRAEPATELANAAKTAEPAAAAEPADPREPTLPSAASLAAEGVTLPKLRLELHAYSARPADRFVFINGAKYLEGATLVEGPRVVSIAPNGAVLTYLGHRFLLGPE